MQKITRKKRAGVKGRKPKLNQSLALARRMDIKIRGLSADLKDLEKRLRWMHRQLKYEQRLRRFGK